jgi:phage I-like protein
MMAARTMRPMPRTQLPNKPVHQTVALSAVLVELDGAPREIRLLPDGVFRSSRDNRPADAPAWVMNGAAAQAIIAAQGDLHSQFLIDYDHQTLRAEQNGKPAPAAGWSGRLEWREGDGLYAVDVEWTEAALAAIAAKEYRYISPLIRYAPKTGVVTHVLMASLSNYPAIDNLNDLAAAAASLFPLPESEDNTMDELLERLRWMLNLPITATAEEIAGELDKLKTQLAGSDGSTTGLSALLTAKDGEIAALSAQVKAAPDPTQYVPKAAFDELQGKLASLSGETLEDKVNALIEANDKKILGPNDKAYLIDLGRKDLAALQGALDARQLMAGHPLAALSGMQTAGKTPPAATDTALDDAAQAVCRQMNIDPEAYKQTLKG